MGRRITREIFGALSQDPASPLSRVSIANSSFSLDPFVGCPARCAYCTVAGAERDIAPVDSQAPNRATLPTKPRQLFRGRELVEALVGHPAFLAHKSVISIGTGSTEAFMPPVGEVTWEILQDFADRGLRNPFWFVVKIGIPSPAAATWNARFHQLCGAGIDVVLAITHSGAPHWVEPYRGDRFGFAHELTAPNLHIAHYLRPIIPGINDDSRSISAALDAAGDAARVICVGGLRVDPGVDLAWSHFHGLDRRLLPPHEDRQKTIPDSYLQELGHELVARNMRVPVFTRSSEMLSHLLGIPEFNLLAFAPSTPAALVSVPGLVQRALSRDHGLDLAELFAQSAGQIGLKHLAFTLVGEDLIASRPMLRQERVALVHAVGHRGLLS